MDVCVYNLYGHRTISCFAFWRGSDIKTQGVRTVVVWSPQILWILYGARAMSVRSPQTF